MTKEAIKQKAIELGQKYFPDECNVWTRNNVEASYVSSACIEMALYVHKTLIEEIKKQLNFDFDCFTKLANAGYSPSIIAKRDFVKEKLNYLKLLEIK